MYEKLFSNVNAPFGPFFAPTRKFNSLVIENAGKVAEFQINVARSYTDIGLKQLRDALRVSDVGDFRRLVASQNEASRTLTAKVLADTQTLVSIGQDFGKEVQKLLAEDVIASIMPATATKGPGTSATTPASRKPV